MAVKIKKLCTVSWFPEIYCIYYGDKLFGVLWFCTASVFLIEITMFYSVENICMWSG